MKNLDRQKIILNELLKGRVVSVSGMATLLEVTSRTILNDIKDLQSYGHEIITEKKGYYKLENISLFIQESQKEFKEKLIYSLASHTFSQFKIDNKVDYILFDTQIEEIENFENFVELSQAIECNFSVKIKYRTHLKTLHPLKIASFNHYWYLIAYDLLDSKVKTYILNEILEVNNLLENLISNEEIENHLKNLQITSPWINENQKNLQLKIFNPFKDYIEKHPPFNSFIIETNQDYVVIEYHYFNQIEAINFIKKYIPYIEVFDNELKQQIKTLLSEWIEKN